MILQNGMRRLQSDVNFFEPFWEYGDAECDPGKHEIAADFIETLPAVLRKVRSYALVARYSQPRRLEK